MRRCYQTLLAAVVLLALCCVGAEPLKTVSADEVKGKMDDPGTLIVDVRTAKEFAAGHIPGARNIPLQDLEKRLGEIDRTKQVIVYCQGGARSGAAQRLLIAKGFAAVRNYQGSWDDWSSRGFPSAKP